ncbi:hypothetical protein NC652_023943 [Populus alba x Populus x berolinensis]|nr:hypothetical protein NC652_023943 [Populus alba x Populus x berolinensis]
MKGGLFRLLPPLSLGKVEPHQCIKLSNNAKLTPIMGAPCFAVPSCVVPRFHWWSSAGLMGCFMARRMNLQLHLRNGNQVFLRR